MTNDLTVFDTNDLLQELGISAEELYAQESLNTALANKVVTYKTSVPESRRLTNIWQDLESDGGGFFSWSIPGNKDFIEELDNVKGKIVKLKGVIVKAELQPALQYYNQEEKKYVTKCTLVGYKDLVTKQLIKGLPGSVSLKNLYEYDKNKISEYEGKTYKGGYNNNKPSKIVEELGLVGSQGMTCANCIRSGCNTLENDKGKTIYCDVINNQLFFYMTGFVSKRFTTPKAGVEPEVYYTEYSIKDVLDEEGVLLQINLSNKLGLKGNYNAVDKVHNAVGYATYIDKLSYAYKGKMDPRKTPYFNVTEISVVGLKGSKYNYLHFQALDVPPNKDFTNLITKAHSKWKELNPQKETILLDPTDYEGSESNSYLVQDYELPSKMKSINVEVVDEYEDEDEDEEEEEECPFG